MNIFNLHLFIPPQLGLVQGLPVQFAYLYPEDVQQVSNPDAFYFIETAVGVEGRALARFGSYCYLNPLNTKLDDYCHMQVRQGSVLSEHISYSLYVSSATDVGGSEG